MRRAWPAPCYGPSDPCGTCVWTVATCRSTLLFLATPSGVALAFRCRFGSRFGRAGAGDLAHPLDGGLRRRVGGRRGRSRIGGCLGAATAAATGTRTGARPARSRASRPAIFTVGCRGRVLLGTLRRLVAAKRVALVDPNLDTDDAVRGVGFRGAVVHVGPQRVQRHPSLTVPLGPRDLRAVQAPRAHDLHAKRAQAHRVLDGP